MSHVHAYLEAGRAGSQQAFPITSNGCRVKPAYKMEEYTLIHRNSSSFPWTSNIVPFQANI
jgi:hypothetical protein